MTPAPSIRASHVRIGQRGASRKSLIVKGDNGVRGYLYPFDGSPASAMGSLLFFFLCQWSTFKLRGQNG
jgi:hypothetical protein